MDKDFKDIIKFQEQERAKKIVQLETDIKQFLEDNRLTLGDALIVLDVVTYDLLKANSEHAHTIRRDIK